jgi:hypothetical protein
MEFFFHFKCNYFNIIKVYIDIKMFFTDENKSLMIRVINRENVKIIKIFT